jgi:hypothetical protein
VVLEPSVRALLVQAGQAAIASHIGCQDGCEPSLYPLGSQGDLPLVFNMGTVRAQGASLSETCSLGPMR